MLSFRGSNPFTSVIFTRLVKFGKHDGFKIHSLKKVIGSSPIASIFKF